MLLLILFSTRSFAQDKAITEFSDMSRLLDPIEVCHKDSTEYYYKVMIGILYELKGYRDTFLKNGKMINLFPTAYYHTTYEEIKRIQNGQFQYPVNKMKQMLVFFDAYKNNRVNWDIGRLALVEPHWLTHFQKTKDDDFTNCFLFADIMLSGVAAHVNCDLPRALRAVSFHGYPEKLTTSKYAENMHSEFITTNDIFAVTQLNLTHDYNKAGGGCPESLNNFFVRAKAFFDLIFTDGVVELRERAWAQAFSGKPLLDLNNKPLKPQPKSYRAQLYTLGRKLLPDVPLSDGAGWLFTNVKSRMGNKEKNSIFEIVSNKVDRNGGLLAGIKDPEKAIYEISIYPVDLNKDGSEEIFVCYSYKGDFGRAANTLLAVIKNKECVYVPCLNFSSQLPDVIYPIGKNLPALVFTDGGFMPTLEGENPIYSWDGYTYKMGKVVNNRQLQLLKRVSIESISKTYQLFLKK